MYYFIYTIYKEPEHEIVLENAIAKTCREFFCLGENAWDYFKLKIESGKIPDYSLTKVKNTDLPKAVQPLKGISEKSGRKHAVWECVDGQISGNWKAGKIIGLCGDCKDWKKYGCRSCDGRMYGICQQTGMETERCTWCNVKPKEETA